MYIKPLSLKYGYVVDLTWEVYFQRQWTYNDKISFIYMLIYLELWKDIKSLVSKVMFVNKFGIFRWKEWSNSSEINYFIAKAILYYGIFVWFNLELFFVVLFSLLHGFGARLTLNPLQLAQSKHAFHFLKCPHTNRLNTHIRQHLLMLVFFLCKLAF